MPSRKTEACWGRASVACFFFCHGRPWEETPGEFEKRLQQAVSWINKKYNVRGLCRGVPDRLRALVHETRGDRLPK